MSSNFFHDEKLKKGGHVCSLLHLSPHLKQRPRALQNARSAAILLVSGAARAESMPRLSSTVVEVTIGLAWTLCAAGRAASGLCCNGARGWYELRFPGGVVSLSATSSCKSARELLNPNPMVPVREPLLGY